MKVKTVVKNVMKKIINPKALPTLMKIKKKKKDIYIDSYLKTYSTMFPGESLHFPHFSDPEVDPEDISFSDIKNGGIRYANLLIDQIVYKDDPILDVGCGLGGLCSMLVTKGYKPVGLTPDHYQYNYIKEKHPEIEIIYSKFEEMDRDLYRHHFGTVITAESLQYLKLDCVFPIINDILKPSGHWIVCDYFKTKAKTSLKHQHIWDNFLDLIDEMGWEILSQQNITKNVLPFLAFTHMFSKRLFLSMVDFFADDLQKKKPKMHYLLEDSIGSLKQEIKKKLRYIDPEIFAQERKYMMLVINKT